MWWRANPKRAPSIDPTSTQIRPSIDLGRSGQIGPSPKLLRPEQIGPSLDLLRPEKNHQGPE